DGSSDSTADVAESHRGAMPVEVLRQGTNQGPGRAFDRGFRRALELGRPDSMIVTLEADTTSDLDAVGQMLTAARSGADVVLASHHAAGELVNVSKPRKFFSSAAAHGISRTSGLG